MITLSMIIAYATYLVAEHLGVSGVIATVMAGLMVGSYGARIGMSARTRLALWAYWEYMSFVINSLLFLLIGIEVPFSSLVAAWSAILLASAFVLIGRAFSVYSLIAISNLFARKIPLAWQHATVWGGLHGAVSIALAMSLPVTVPARDTILTITFGVVALSIVLQGLTMKPALRLLGVKSTMESEHDRVRAQAIAVKAAQRELERLTAEALISPAAQEHLREELNQRLQALRSEIAEIEAREPESLEKDLKLARSRLARAEKNAIHHAAAEGLISTETGDEMMRQTDQFVEHREE